MKIKIPTLIFIVVIFILLSANCYSQEAIHLTTDRSTYIAGEPIWFYAFCTKSNSNTNSSLSKVGYVEILNDNNIPVLQTKIHLEEGNNSVRLYLPDSLKTGNYQIRSYTQLMKNYHYDLFDYKTITIINPFSKERFAKNDSQFYNDTVIVFPEGGTLINETENKIVIQILDSYGIGRQVNAALINAKMDTIRNFKTNKSGFAKINFTPTQNQSYKIIYIIDNNQVILNMDLKPENKITIALIEKNKECTFKILSGNINTINHLLHLSNVKGDFISEYKFENEIVSIPKDSIPDGYICAQLITKEGTLLSSRYFIAKNNTTTQKLAINLPKQDFTNREKVQFSIDGYNDLKNISISVTKKCLKDKTHFISNRHHVESYSFSELINWTGNGITINDILICFEAPVSIWFPEPTVKYLPEYEGKLLSGTMYNKTTQEPIVNEDIILNFVGSKSSIAISKTDSLGKFSFLANQYGEHEIVIQPLKNDTSLLDYYIDLDESYCTVFPKNKLPVFTLTTEDAELINKAIINMQINTIYDIGKSTGYKIDNNSDSLSFYGEPEYYIPMAKYIELVSTEEIIRELVPFTNIQKHKGEYSIKITEAPSYNRNNGESFTIVDGVYIKDFNKILALPGEELKKIELINLNYFAYGHELGKIIAFYTKKGNLNGLEFDERIFRQTQTCYCTPYKYVGPTYEAVDSTIKNFPDFRNLLYWNTNVKSKQHTFYTTDEKSTYTITIEGINSFGEKEYISTDINVN